MKHGDRNFVVKNSPFLKRSGPHVKPKKVQRRQFRQDLKRALRNNQEL
jgi:hypothetical protein